MRSDTEEGGVKGCKARRSLPKVLQMVWASVHTGLEEDVWGDNFDHGRYHDISVRKQKDSG